ncbi:MAG: GntR family transcriptional regulator [Pseudomonadota bacterium]
MNINFILSQTDSRPMYLQIMEQINQRVAIGDWPPGTKLPSIRELAVALQVSVITVKRAYLELERQGVILTRQGKGSWINDQLDIVNVQMQELEEHLQRVAELSESMAMSEDDLIALLKQQLKPRS